MRNNHRLIKRIVTLILSAVLVCGTAVSVSAVSLRDKVVNALTDRYDDSINDSYLSSEKIYLGNTITMHAVPAEIDPSLCTYAFYFRPKGLIWFNLRSYSEDPNYYWTPTVMGDYEVCIKVKFGHIIGKKYFDVRVTRELVSKAYISSSFIQQGSTVELSGGYEGGFGTVSSAFYYKSKDSEDWNVLSDYSSADLIKWRPTQIGEYDICIKVKDMDDQLQKRYFDLTVSEALPRTPTEFTVTVRSPISSPYFWRISLTDENILDYYVVEKPAELEDLKTYAILEYHFRTKSAGRTSIGLTYDTYNGEKYSLVYDVTVDRNLNYTVNSKSGNYSEKTLPEPEQITGSFSISVLKPDAGCRWKCEISDNVIADIDKVDTSAYDVDTYTFKTFRKGSFTVTLTCNNISERTEKYKLIYDLTADEDLGITVFNKDGVYAYFYELPEVVQ